MKKSKGDDPEPRPAGRGCLWTALAAGLLLFAVSLASVGGPVGFFGRLWQMLSEGLGEYMKDYGGFWTLLVVSTILAVVFLRRWDRSGKP